jgi:hypothetical protein
MSSILLKPQNKTDYFSTQSLHKRLRKDDLIFEIDRFVLISKNTIRTSRKAQNLLP